MKQKIIYILIIIFIILIFINNNLVLISCIDAFNLWFYKVFPYLFVMFIINDILININFEKIFNNTNIYIFIMSLISGSPSSAFIIGNLYKNNKINKEHANKSLLFTYFANPLFLYTFFKSIFSTYIAIKLMIIHYLSNIIIYIIFRKKIISKKIINRNAPKINISNSIKKSMNTLIMILGVICFFMIISNMISNTFNLNIVSNCFIKGFLELTQGLNYLQYINISNNIKEIIAITFISFGGISIHTQIKCILDEYNLEYKNFLKGRLYQIIIAIILIYILNIVLKVI